MTDDPAPWLLYACPCGCGLLVTADEHRAIRDRPLTYADVMAHRERYAAIHNSTDP